MIQKCLFYVANKIFSVGLNCCCVFCVVQTSASRSRTPTPRIESTSHDSPSASSVPEATVSPAVSDGQCVKYNITDTGTLANSDGIFPVQNDEPATSEAGDVCGDDWPGDKDSSMLENSENMTCDENLSGWHLGISSRFDYLSWVLACNCVNSTLAS